MNIPVLDGRSLDDLRAQVRARAAAYTPEWRFEHTEDDPGAAIAELFCRMLEQSVDRMNSVPEKLYTEFLNLIGFRMPPPATASGVMQFSVHGTVQQPVRVPVGTQVFTPDAQGQNIVYETTRTIEATPARLTDLYYADGAADRIERLDLTQPQPFFAPAGDNLQRHCFWLSQPDVLRLDGPGIVTLTLRQQARHQEAETAQRLARMHWTYLAQGAPRPFDAVRTEAGRIMLEKHDAAPIEPDAHGRLCVCCTGTPDAALTLAGAALTSAPLARCAADRLFAGDLPIEAGQGGYCFGRRPAPYGLFYLRADTPLSKRGATVNLQLDIAPIVDEPPAEQPHYNFTQSIIDKTQAVVRKPDDVFVSAVVWEYFNGTGWRQLTVTGDRNPFSCKREGNLELRFTVPDDLCAAPVNAEDGLYIRARVAEIENQFSTLPRWIVPFVHAASFDWAYEHPVPAAACGAENNGMSTVIVDAASVSDLQLPALTPMQRAPRAIYLRFDRSPSAMPLSLLFEVMGRIPSPDKLIWEQAGETGFAPVSTVDQTGDLHHTGHVLLYLSEPLPARTFFGQTGYWLRVSRSSYFEAAAPRIAAVHCNTVPARQTERQPDVYFDAAPYEADKTVRLLTTPVAACEVWVDEVSALPLADAQALAAAQPGDTVLTWADSVLTHCWVRWQAVENLSLAAPGARAYVLDPYTGIVTFGNGHHGRVPPAGSRVIRISAVSGGGTRGNVPAGQVNAVVGALPRISSVTNLTPMRGGTDRFPRARIDRVGNKRLRHRGRAAGQSDFEELVLEHFAQVRHVRCVSGLDENGQPAPGHVTVVVMGRDNGRTADDLCDRVYEFLSARCACWLVAEGRLHVRPATLLTVHTRITAAIDDLDRAAEVQQAVIDRVTRLISETWHARQIGEQILTDELWTAVRDTPGVRLIDRILIEGAYDADGQPRLAALERGVDFPYAVVCSGTHQVRVR